MLSYRHHFHAGNYSDVFKHISLILILNAMKRKNTPMLYLDTHSGAGLYDLLSPEAQKIGEHQQGVLKVWNREDLPAVIQPYAELLHRMNPSGTLSLYPGSPWIAHHLLDQNDRIVLNELHSSDMPILTDLVRPFRNMRVYHQDGLQQVNALLPPPEKRGLIFIDPSYEIKSDYESVAQTLIKVHKKFAHGVYAIWYPLLKSGIQNNLLDPLKHSGIEHQCIIECKANVDKEARMYGSGMLIINPPYQVDTQIKEAVKWLQKVI